jgi:hypothetical protein
MRNTIISFITAGILLAGCNEIKVHSTKSVLPLKVDGRLNEWNVNDFTSVNDNQLKLGYTKDAGFIYVAGITTNKNLIRQASLNGINIWIDPSGEENKDLLMELKLPQAKRVEYYKGGFFAALTDKQKKNVLQTIDSLKQGVVVTDIKNNNSINYAAGEDKFAGKIYLSRDTLMFETKIPAAINKTFESYQPVTKNCLIGITLNGGYSGFLNRPAPYTQGGMRGMGGMGGPGRDSTFRRSDESFNRPEELEIWFKLED